MSKKKPKKPERERPLEKTDERRAFLRKIRDMLEKKRRRESD
jgi:hypothetical protein